MSRTGDQYGSGRRPSSARLVPAFFIGDCRRAPPLSLSPYLSSREFYALNARARATPGGSRFTIMIDHAEF